MKNFLILLILLPGIVHPHPGVGIVKDSKGNIFYSDLNQVWKISKGKKTIVVPKVHSHELYIDINDNLYGEGNYYNPGTEKFFQYLWVYRPDGKLDTLIGVRQAYVCHNFSLARDKQGNEYYLKRFLAPHTDTTTLYRKSSDGTETIFARGNFKNVNWLHPQDDGSIMYVSQNAIYKADSVGKIHLIKEGIADPEPSFPFSGKNPAIWGIWKDDDAHIYAAVFSDQAVKKIDIKGNMTVIYKSTGNWTPLNGVFDDHNNLWLLETSDKNEVRALMIKPKDNNANTTAAPENTSAHFKKYIIISGIIGGLLLFSIFRSKKRKRNSTAPIQLIL